MPGHLQGGFGCVVSNRFDQLFDDESDPFEVLQAAENKKKEAGGGGGGGPGTKSATQAAAQTSSGAAGKRLREESQRDETPPPPPPGDARETPPPALPAKERLRLVGRRPDPQLQGEGKFTERRPDRRPPREGRCEKPLEEKGEGGEFSVARPTVNRPVRGCGGPGRGRAGRGRGPGRGDGFDSRDKREFDRHSGSYRSGLKPEDKRGGSGSHNWGTIKDELTDLDQSNVTEETPEGEEHPVADTENKENEVEEEKEEGPKEMTLDEWKAIQIKDRAKVEFTLRKPNEGADGQWKKGFVLHKSKSEEAHAEESVMDRHFRKPANDITSQLEINFGDLSRPGWGGRGGRGGRGHGGRPTDKSRASAPDVDDPEAFPALA
ncbi:plasminogen activator inhibitor 1 RNA-binding protein-like [Nycticebus coucang]|uniref:plasminogen activator inhibitor 1 RNA-binding protein-like n=1 Tax=Nycticebus coucang TaxID=9470 RepID=UPI00234E0BB0|nr:plasminogen activator inhibitor 1 RNA-binding protein-like [Nycticebus coucang]